MKLKKRVRKVGGLKPVAHEADFGLEAEQLQTGKRRKVVEELEAVDQRQKDAVEEEDEEEEEAYLDAATTRKVLQNAREQLEDVDEEAQGEQKQKEKNTKTVQFDISSDEEVVEEEEEEDDYDEEEFDYLEEAKISPAEERALAMFGMQTGAHRTLADIIQEKLDEAEERKRAVEDEEPEDPMNTKVVEVYKGVALIMKSYTSGKVPKAFKIIPNTENWEKLIWLTNPNEWSPASVFVATRLFASNLDEKRAQLFYADVLLPRVRDDIAVEKKLHYSIYQSLKKALFKPKAFFKGILFPLCEDASCTLHEATIIASVVSKISIPMLHSAAALLRLAGMKYSGSTSIFVRILLEKKYALPYKVVDGLVDHFVRMQKDTRKLPVLWHRSLLTFSQRYKTVITSEQKERLKVLMRAQFHPAITPEIRRELFSTRSRGDIHDPDANTIAMQIASAS